MRNLSLLLFPLIVCINLSFSPKKKVFRKTFYFASDSHELDSIELVKAKRYLSVLGKFNLTKVKIYGYTDSDGSPAYNMTLSKRRVNTINNLLMKQGYDTNILLEAKGEVNPTYDNQTEKEKNRRVEVLAYYSSKKGKETVSIIKQKTVTISKGRKLKKDDLKRGIVLSLPSVRFEPGSTRLLPGALNTIRKIIPILKSNPSIKIEVAGHVCCGNDIKLSAARAKKIYTFLIKNGIEGKNLTYKGYSNTQPLYGNIMDIRNRRVELRIL